MGFFPDWIPPILILFLHLRGSQGFANHHPLLQVLAAIHLFYWQSTSKVHVLLQPKSLLGTTEYLDNIALPSVILERYKFTLHFIFELLGQTAALGKQDEQSNFRGTVSASKIATRAGVATVVLKTLPGCSPGSPRNLCLRRAAHVSSSTRPRILLPYFATSGLWMVSL